MKLKDRWKVPTGDPNGGMRTSRALRGADSLGIFTAVLALLVGFGLLTPELGADITESVRTLIRLLEDAMALMLAIVAAGTQLVRWLRLALGKE